MGLQENSAMSNIRLDRRSFMGLSAAALMAAACGSSKPTGSGGGSSDSASLRLGYFPNLTHVQPNVGLENGAFAKALGDNVKLEPKAFNAGPAVIEALLAGDIDASYIGPSPAVNGYVQSNG